MVGVAGEDHNSSYSAGAGAGARADTSVSILIVVIDKFPIYNHLYYNSLSSNLNIYTLSLPLTHVVAIKKLIR